MNEAILKSSNFFQNLVCRHIYGTLCIINLVYRVAHEKPSDTSTFDEDIFLIKVLVQNVSKKLLHLEQNLLVQSSFLKQIYQMIPFFFKV